MAEISKIPTAAVGGDNLVEPTQKLLRELGLLAKEGEETDGFGTAVKGSPFSISVIEAGATAFSKWWAVGLGGSVVAIWSGVRGFWFSDGALPLRDEMLWGAAIVTAAVILTIGIIVSSDVRARAIAQAVTTNERGRIAAAMLKTVADLQGGGDELERQAPPTAANSASSAVALPAGLTMRYLVGRGEQEERDWTPLLVVPNDDSTKLRYLIGKGGTTKWVNANEVEIDLRSRVGNNV